MYKKEGGVIRIRLTKSIEDRLAALAQVTEQSKASLVREALVKYLDRIEGRYLIDTHTQPNHYPEHSQTVDTKGKERDSHQDETKDDH